MDAKKKIVARVVTLLGIPLLAFGIWWWIHDPFRPISGIEDDQTIYYREAKPVFITPRRQRTLFMRGVNSEALLAHTKKRYPEQEGWIYRTDEMPRGFRVERAIPDDKLPETIDAFDTLDGRFQLVELRAISSLEAQFVRRTRGSDAFQLYPGMPSYRAAPVEFDTTRFIRAG